MEPALDILNRALSGSDEGAVAFLEQTTSIYVLDATDSSNLRIYGCWNFIHQALNDVERHEAGRKLGGAVQLIPHMMLMSTLALRVARRSPSMDRALVATCLDNNAESQCGSTDATTQAGQTQFLIDVNTELREIVLARIAAMAFDFSFHRRGTGPHGHSVFANRGVMDSFCKILSANATSSGPPSIQHFATEWVIPSSRNLPLFAVVSVVLHLALEGMRKSAPAGTKDTLQQLSAPVMSVVLLPALADAVTGNENSSSASHGEGNGRKSSPEDDAEIASICLRAMKSWCDATGMSLPQIRHVTLKVGINVISVLGKCMYSDSHDVLDSLAEFIEAVVVKVKSNDCIPTGRLNQVRHIMQVDEAFFHSQFSSDQLLAIESKEMETIVEEVVSAIGLQRFRFQERQHMGDHDICRNLACVAASTFAAWLDTHSEDLIRSRPEPGMVALLVMAAGHPSVNVCGIVLPVLTRSMSVVPSLSQELLPILQRRAIPPHHDGQHGIKSLIASDLCGVNFVEFRNFRESLLKDALVACWQSLGDYYMDSCTSAVEEFCSDNVGVGATLQLEAALYCIEVIRAEASDGRGPTCPHSGQLQRCLAAISRRPPCLMANPLTVARLCGFIRQYLRWFFEAGELKSAAELALSVFSMMLSDSALSLDPEGETFRESSISPLNEAAQTLREMLCQFPREFMDEHSLAALRAAWGASQTAATERISIDDRLALGIGLCHLLILFPESRLDSYVELVTPSLNSIERLANLLRDTHQGSPEMASVLSHIADEMRFVATISRTYTNACAGDAADTESGGNTSSDKHESIPEPVLEIIRRSWPTISQVACDHCDNKDVSSALAVFLCEMLPPCNEDDVSLTLMRDLVLIVSTMLKTSNGDRVHCYPVLRFLEELVLQHGDSIEKNTAASLAGASVSAQDRQVGQMLEDLILGTVAAVRRSLGTEGARPNEQRQGQSASETKPAPLPPKPELASSEALAGVFSLLTKCMNTCPVFLFHLPSGPGVDRDDDMLLRRAINAAVTSLDDDDPDITLEAIKFLLATEKQAGTTNAELRRFIVDQLAAIRTDGVKRTLLGCYGKYNHCVIEQASELLSVLNRLAPSPEELEASLIAALGQDDFLLGDAARNASLAVLTRCAQGELSQADLTEFLLNTWQLHQIEDKDSLPVSGAVEDVIRKYRPSP